MARPRVALVFPGRIRRDSFFGFLLPSMALERLGAAVEDVSDVALFDARFETDLLGEVVAFRPDIAAVNVKTTLYSGRSYDFARDLRRALPSVRIVTGGLHATACPEEALEICDYVIRGDGEGPFRCVVLGEKPEDVPGLVYEGTDGIVSNPMAEPNPNMDELRPPARHLRKPHYRYTAAGLFPMDLLETSRGCTHACSFCSPAAVHPGKYRFHSAEYVMEEVRRLHALGVKYCMLTDDHFGGDFERTERLCDLIVELGIRICFFTFIRPFTGHMELKRKMVAAGFIMFSYGAESPSRDQLRRYGKGYPDGAPFIKQVNTEWLEAGACYIGNSYVFGDVRDSGETIAALGAYARSLDSTYIEPLYSQPYPGTRYRKELEAEGRLLPRPWSDFTEGRLLLRHPDLDEEGMRRLRARMWVEFFSPRKAGGVFRVPLYLHGHLGIPVLTVLRYMKACDYSLFGCVLENKFYSDLQLQMVHRYFRRTLATFEPEEMVMDEALLNAFLNMIGLAWGKRLLGDLDLALEVREGPQVHGTLLISLRAGTVAASRVVTGAWKAEPGRRTWVLPVPLYLLANQLGAASHVKKLAALLAIVGNLVLLDVPRRLLSWFGSPGSPPTVSKATP